MTVDDIHGFEGVPDVLCGCESCFQQRYEMHVNSPRWNSIDDLACGFRGSRGLCHIMCLMAGHLQYDNAKPNVLQGSKGQPLASWLVACRFCGF